MAASRSSSIRRAGRRLLSAGVVGAALVAGFAPAQAAEPVTGDGEFTSRGLTMPVASSVAYRGKSLLDKQDVIVVAISNSHFDLPWMALFHDRTRLIEKRFAGSNTAVVHLEFRPDGSYKAHSFHFKSGNNCGYCAGNLGVTSTVKIAGGRIAGTLRIKDTDKNADVKIDTPILSDDHGPALPAGGGEPGKAYMAYHEAMVTGVPAKVLPHLSKANGKYIDEAVKKGRSAQIMKVYAKEHPDKSVKIVRGWSKGDTALLLWEGETSILRLSGEAVMVREGGRWVVDEELSELKMQ